MNGNIINLNNVKDIGEWIKKEENVYVGRASKKVPSTTSDKWGNPHIITHNNPRQKVVESYRQHIFQTENLHQSLGELKGKVLGCWCSPNPCHAEILHQLAGNSPLYQSSSAEMSSEVREAAPRD